jgi:hypothetical protein
MSFLKITKRLTSVSKAIARMKNESSQPSLKKEGNVRKRMTISGESSYENASSTNTKNPLRRQNHVNLDKLYQLGRISDQNHL